MEVKKHFSESDLPLNTKFNENNARRRLISIRNKSTMDSRMSTILSSTATVGDSNFCYTPNRDDIIEVRKKLKKVPEDCARVSEKTSSSPATSESDIAIKDGRKADCDENPDYNNVKNPSITTEEEEDEDVEEDEGEEEEDEEEEEEEEEGELEKEVEIALEKKSCQIVSTDKITTQAQNKNTNEEDFHILETILSSAVAWIHFFVLIVWLATVALWYILPLVGVQDTFIDKLMTTADSMQNTMADGIVRKYLLKIKQNLFRENY